MKKYCSYILSGFICTQALSANAGTFQPFVDVLAWRAYETNSAWAETITAPAGQTKVLNSINSYNTRPGVKAGFYYLPSTENAWNTKFYWTHYATDTTDSIPVGAKIITSLFFSGSFFLTKDFFIGASSHWQLAMNMLDVEINRHFTPNKAFTLSPKVGLKGGSINQEISARWVGITYKANENVTSNFTGIGPTLGLGAKWNIYENISLVGDVAAGIMYGRWNMKDTYERPPGLLVTTTTVTTSLNQAQLGSFMTNYFLGAEWVHRGVSTVTVKLGYEMQFWSNQLRIISIQQLPAQGDLTLQGATCGISIDL